MGEEGKEMIGNWIQRLFTEFPEYLQVIHMQGYPMEFIPEMTERVPKTGMKK
jgi:hypothetical protein